MSQRLRQICAWCGVELSPGAEPVSHGICGPCGERFDLEGASLVDLHQRLAELSLAVEGLSAASEEGSGVGSAAVVGALEVAIGRTATVHRELVRRARNAEDDRQRHLAARGG